MRGSGSSSGGKTSVLVVSGEEEGGNIYLGLPKFGSEPRFEPQTAGPDLQVWAQVLLGGWFLRTGLNLEPKCLIWS